MPEGSMTVSTVAFAPIDLAKVRPLSTAFGEREEPAGGMRACLSMLAPREAIAAMGRILPTDRPRSSGWVSPNCAQHSKIKGIRHLHLPRGRPGMYAAAL